MLLNRLRIANFRNHSATDIDCPEGTLLLLGENGAGKTTVLEAISLLCTSRSFVTRQDKGLVAIGAQQFSLEGAFTTSTRSRRHVTVEYPLDQRKRIEVDFTPLDAASDLIGMFPLVALSPQHRPITSGGPAERRAFIDFVLSQVHHNYLEDLLTYRRVLKQRNTLLAEADGRLSAIAGVIDAWDQALAESGVRILRKRAEFIGQYLPYVHQSMSGIIEGRESVDINYVGSCSADITSGDAAAQYLTELIERRPSDLRRGVTSMGPHRDDLSIMLNGLDVRAQASQGQHKTILIALKIAEYHYLDEHLDETPLLLLDDVFSELDDARLDRVLALTQGLGQTFITSAHTSLLHVLDGAPGDHHALRIESGGVYRLADVA
ncbi:MAG: DNA replication/repair protein RecF [Bacteroidia bacterium]|nr:DNA replication/repair protein RecF [Bacteroidia bacterium]